MEDRWYHARLWHGMHLSAWLRLLARNRFSVSPSRLPETVSITAVSTVNSVLRWFQILLFARRAARVKIQPDPVFIIGHWRTGTTLLHELLALDRRHRCPTTYECLCPGHFLLTGRLFPRWLSFMLPATRPTDRLQISFASPQEDEFGLCLRGVPSPYAAVAFPNHPAPYPEYADLEGLSKGQLEHWEHEFRTFLKYLLLARTGQLVLKSPPHTFRLNTLNRMFPEARFIHLVRSPYAVFPSTVYLWTRFCQLYGLQTPTLHGIQDRVFETLTAMYRRLEEARPLIDPARFFDLRYEELVRDPASMVQAIYEHFGWPGFTDVRPALLTYVEKSRGFRTNSYPLSQELRQEITRRWASYIERYGYVDRAKD